MAQPDEYWRRYRYFNAGFFYYKCPKIFGDRYQEYATAIRDDPPAELDGQEIYPWLDQIALPLVISFARRRARGRGSACARSFGDVARRVLSLLYAR